MQIRHRAIYAAFDRFPSRKGAAIHIDRFARTLFSATGGGLLYVAGDETLPRWQFEGAIEIVRSRVESENFLDRALGFSEGLRPLVARHRRSLEIAHFRDPWSGVPLLPPWRSWKSVYEVNALPSIELGHRYPHIAPQTLAKIERLEAWCLAEADEIVVPSEAVARCLAAREVDPAKVSVIRNGADLLPPQPPPAGAPERYLLYFGALQPWQGVDVLLRSFARLADLTDLRLVIVASHRSRSEKRLRRLAEKLGVGERTIWHSALGAEELAAWCQHAAVSVAPLTACSRNLDQGCAPLKIVESMAAGAAVVASDLPSVREVMRDGVEGRLVPPGRPGDLARVLRILLEYPEVALEMGRRGRERIARELTWEHSTGELAKLYGRMLPGREREEKGIAEVASGGSR